MSTPFSRPSSAGNSKNVDGPSGNISYTASTARTARVDGSHVGDIVNNPSQALRTSMSSRISIPTLSSVGNQFPDGAPQNLHPSDSNVYSSIANDHRFVNARENNSRNAKPSGNITTSLRNLLSSDTAGMMGTYQLPSNNDLSGRAESPSHGSVPFPAVLPPPTDHETIPAPAEPTASVAPLKKRIGRVKTENRKRKADSPNLKKAKKKKESCFSSEEAMELARAWVNQMSSGEGLSESNLWNTIHNTCKIDHELARTPESLKCAWDDLSQDIRNFVLARTKINEQRSPNATDNEVDKLVQNLYRQLRGWKGKNRSGGVPKFKYIEAADYLSKEPIFMEKKYTNARNIPSQSDEVPRGEEPSKAPDVDVGNNVEVGSSSKSVSSAPEGLIISSESDAVQARKEGESTKKEPEETIKWTAHQIANMVDRSRPLGLKKTIERDRQQEEEKRFKENIESIKKSMARANRLFEESLRRDEDLALLQVLQKDSAEFKQVLKAVMNRRALEDNLKRNQETAHVDDAEKKSLTSSVGNGGQADGRSGSAAGPHEESGVGK